MDMSIQTQNKVRQDWIERGLVIIGFTIIGMLIGFSTYLPQFNPEIRITLKIALPVTTLIITYGLFRSKDLHRYWHVGFGFTAISIGILVAHYAGNLLLEFFHVSVNTVQGIALAKLGEMLAITIPILILIALVHYDRISVYLSLGNLTLGLPIGLGSFLLLGVLAAVQATGMGVDRARFVAAIPWMLLFALSNAFMEELWFRALFLRKLGTVLKPAGSLLLTSFVFAIIHIDVAYVSPAEFVQFMAALFSLGLLFGYVMHKTGSILAPVLFHAGADLLVIVGFLGAL